MGPRAPGRLVVMWGTRAALSLSNATSARVVDDADRSRVRSLIRRLTREAREVFKAVLEGRRVVGRGEPDPAKPVGLAIKGAVEIMDGRGRRNQAAKKQRQAATETAK